MGLTGEPQYSLGEGGPNPPFNWGGPQIGIFRGNLLFSGGKKGPQGGDKGGSSANGGKKARGGEKGVSTQEPAKRGVKPHLKRGPKKGAIVPRGEKCGPPQDG